MVAGRSGSIVSRRVAVCAGVLLLALSWSATAKSQENLQADSLRAEKLFFLVRFIDVAKTFFADEETQKALPQGAVAPILEDLDDLDHRIRTLLPAEVPTEQLDTNVASVIRKGLRPAVQQSRRPLSLYPTSFKSLDEQRAYNLREMYRMILLAIHLSGGRLKPAEIDETDILLMTGGDKTVQCPVDKRHRQFGYVLPYSVIPGYHGDVMVYEIAPDDQGKRGVILANRSVLYLTDKELADRLRSGIHELGDRAPASPENP